MTNETSSKPPLNLGRKDTEHRIKPQPFQVADETVVQHLKTLVPLLWGSRVMIKKEVDFGVKFDQGTSHELTIVANGKLYWESRVIDKEGKLIIKGTLRVEFPNGIDFTFPNQ